MLAVSSEPFDSPGHLYEIKWDGYRGLAYLDGGTEILSRNLLDIGLKFPELGQLHKKVGGQPAIIDGEIVVFENGKPSFAGIQSRGRSALPGRINQGSIERPAVFVAFDVLYREGKSVMDLPLGERKKLLGEIVSPGDEIILSQYISESGVDFYNACAGEDLEGVVAKALESPYLPGRRSPYWKKFRHTQEADLIICGYQPSRDGRSLGSLVLGASLEDRLVYQGKVGTGFSNSEAESLLDALGKIETNFAVLNVPPAEKKQTRWVKPLLVCTVNYLTTTAEGYLRHPVYRGLRWDKSPGECLVATEQ
ncbi:MAG: ATP-dependent DNA ligase [Peptococcaceae bacterium BRH_c4b]|nr:MAG: ATP-dependent DNA ligase [Peptococcaceae bacterium BRH_c4b]